MSDPSPRPEAFRAPPGTHDVLPPASARWVALLAAVHERMRRANYGLVHGPLFEELGVFRRIGEGTDVVTKEMYDFVDKGGRHLALRPESTAAICRAFVSHRPTTPWKVWYLAPHFRYERAQAGRYRQHHQIGAEVLGSDDPDLDVEVIALAAGILDDVGLRDVRLHVNSLGDAATRNAYAAALAGWLGARADELDPADAAKIDTHPLRVLDSKRPAAVAVTAEAPPIAEFLTAEAADHLARVLDGLASVGIDVVVDPRLVRGLDYYTHTTFEFVSAAIDAAQSTVCGGGRYGGLVEQLGGPATPGIGFGMGIERLLLAADAEGTFEAPAPGPDVFVVDTTGGTAARRATERLRSAGLSADRAFDDRSMKAQMKAADRSGAAVAVIVGPDERAAGEVTVRPLRAGGAQRRIADDDLEAELTGLLAHPDALARPRPHDTEQNGDRAP